MTDRREFYIDFENCTYKMAVFIDKKDLKINISCPNQILPIIYEKTYKKNDLLHLSNYFNRFSSLSDICNNISILIAEKRYLLKKESLNGNFLILNLFPDPINEPDGIPIEIEFKIPLNKIASEHIVKNLFTIISDMSIQINNLNDKIKKLESEHVSKSQIIDSNNRIEKVNTKLNKLNKLNLNIEGNNFLSNIKTVISKNIVLSKDDDNLLKNWINRGNIKLSLIYKATIDSDFSNAFHSKCDDHAPTITIIKTEEGIRFGGYTTKTWNCKEECKKDDNAFLFSLDKRKKYPIKKGTECAIYCNNDFGPTFGEGFDLCLCDNYMGVNGSYSYFPTSYGKGNPTNELTNNNFNFKISEVEVFQVEFLK